MNAGQILNSILGTKPDLDEDAIHGRIVDIEKRILWIDSELNSKENESLDTCRYSKEMLESLDDERHILSLLANVMYRRGKILDDCK